MLQNILFQSISHGLYVPLVCLRRVFCELALQAASRPIHEKGPCKKGQYDCTFRCVLTRIGFLMRLQGISVRFLCSIELLCHQKY
jgi:hypothetical protein